MKHVFITILIVLSGNLFGQESIVNLTSIDTTQFVNIGGIQQFISIKGYKNKPLLLYLHGGPGAASSSHRHQITNQLEADFLVVHWDQRGSGKSENSHKMQPNVLVMKQDAEEMLFFLMKAYQKNSIVLVANSWGTVLGFHLALKYPNNITSLVAISPLINNQKSQKLTNKKLIKHYNKHQKTNIVKQLKSIQIPYEKVEDMAIQYRWMSDFNGTYIPENEFNQYMTYFKKWEQQWMPLYKELYAINKLKHKTVFKIPTYILIGKQDLTTHFKLTEAFFKKLKAPKKQLFWLANVGHQIPMYKAEEMQRLLYTILVNNN